MLITASLRVNLGPLNKGVGQSQISFALVFLRVEETGTAHWGKLKK